MKFEDIYKPVIAVAVSQLAGIIGSMFTVSAIPNWYAGLVKPELNPPSWLFSPVWITLYTLMGIAAFLVYKKAGKRKEGRVALKVFGLQLVFNAMWSVVFFGLQSPGWAFANIVALWLAIVWTIIVFSRISKPAAWLLVPYILWVSFALYLNYMLWTLN